ncbi:MAG TPA: hypothetical protein VE890_04020, partial [Thermoguttaceae bacterium]|nr:hypothetical protein [Thermoguttaceae bacterium]
MPSRNDTFYNLKRLHVIFLVASAALLGVTVWMLRVDYQRQWKGFQRAYRDHVEQTAEPLAIRQLWLPDLPLDYNFSQVARFDRCGTCHLGIDKTGDAAQETHRQLPQPYSTHPRPNLFVGPTSPHPVNDFGCTICHDGQGSATDFRWASHSPNDWQQQTAWREKYDWERNAHWGFPMLPKRFDQSRCLKCHHEVDDLQPSERFPNPPAPKLVAGYQNVRRLGCFGCHEINGFDESGRRVGPDLRLESVAAKNTPPGTMRKVGPSLRETSEKLGMAMLLDWIRNPQRFLPTAKMPRFYGNHEHLEGPALGDAKRFEAVEAWAVAMVLWTAGPRTELLPAPEAVTEPASVERGKQSFLLHGCLACHQHTDFPEGQATQGPDLSGIGAKYHSVSGAAWLTDWLRDPHRHSPRTLMPSPLLEPERILQDTDDENASPRMADPAADIAAYLL